MMYSLASLFCHVCRSVYILFFFFFNDTATTEIYTLSLHDALPISDRARARRRRPPRSPAVLPARSRTPSIPRARAGRRRSEEHTSELQSRLHLVCRLLLEKKKKTMNSNTTANTRQCTQETV